MRHHTTAVVVVLLFLLSACIYAVQVVVFGAPRDTLFYLFQDWAFLPVQIALVTVVVGRLMADRERRERAEKTNMLASSFFSDVGAAVMRMLLERTVNACDVAPLLKVQAGWDEKRYAEAAVAVREVPLDVRMEAQDLCALRDLLAERHLALLVIASNPVLLEHEEFTDMLWALFHLSDEFAYRSDLEHTSQPELDHLNDDASRALRMILVNWLGHMRHIGDEYPYLFSIARLQCGRTIEE